MEKKSIIYFEANSKYILIKKFL